SAALGVTMLALATVPDVGAAIPAALLVGLTSILYMTSTTAIIQVEADPAFHGRILSLQTFIIGGTACIGGPILGWLADSPSARAWRAWTAVARPRRARSPSSSRSAPSQWGRHSAGSRRVASSSGVPTRRTAGRWSRRQPKPGCRHYGTDATRGPKLWRRPSRPGSRARNSNN